MAAIVFSFGASGSKDNACSAAIRFTRSRNASERSAPSLPARRPLPNWIGRAQSSPETAPNPPRWLS
jgi:hypothetical protein